MFRFLLIITVLGCLSTSALAQDLLTVAQQNSVQSFLSKHCFDCHGKDSQEGNVRLDQLALQFDSRAVAERWLKVVRKIKTGEMPPEDEPRPPKEQVASVSQWLQTALIAADRKRQEVDGRVVLRRLNRVEYENTINDLFGIDVKVKETLPEDATAHGFDNIGEALNISSVLLERYLEAADVALDAAIQTGPRPKTSKGRYSYQDERRVKDHRSYLKVNDGLVFFSSGYSPTEINQFRASRAGNYRIRVSAYAYQSDKPVTYRVYGRDGDQSHLAGYFDAGLEPTVSEFTTRLGFRNTIRVVPYGTWLAKWNAAATEKGSGLVVQWVEIEGPLIADWPPESHRRIFGDLPIEVTNAEEIRRNRRLQPNLEVVSKNTTTDATTILKRLLPKLFRRTIDEKDWQPYWAIISAKIDEGYSFQEAVRVGLKAAMCAPEFLYLKEQQGRVLDSFQLASRLSYFLWSTMPDEQLFDLAAKGELSRKEVLQQQTERMLKDARAARFTENFVGQWLDLREIDFTSPDTILYPEFDELLKTSMIQETQLFFDELLKHDLSVLNFVDSDFTILNERLARHYNIDGVTGQAFRKVSVPQDSHRGGVLTQASVLKVTANGTNTSPVLRGVWVLDRILGQPAPPPPANVPAVEPDIRGAVTIREQMAKHREIASCAVCHRRIDPAGFALEQFDVIGGWRENYRSVGNGERVEARINGRGVRYKRGLPVDASDTLPNGQRFETVEEFKQLLLKNEQQIARCLTEKLLTYATGSGIQLADQSEVEGIVNRIKSKEYGLRSLVHEVVQSAIFRKH